MVEFDTTYMNITITILYMMQIACFLFLQTIYKEVKERSIPKVSCSTRAEITAQEAHNTAQTEEATALQVRPSAMLHSGGFLKGKPCF